MLLFCSSAASCIRLVSWLRYFWFSCSSRGAASLKHTHITWDLHHMYKDFTIWPATEEQGPPPQGRNCTDIQNFTHDCSMNTLIIFNIKQGTRKKGKFCFVWVIKNIKGSWCNPVFFSCCYCCLKLLPLNTDLFSQLNMKKVKRRIDRWIIGHMIDLNVNGSVTCRWAQVRRWGDEGSWRAEPTATTETPAAGWTTRDSLRSSFVSSFEPEEKQRERKKERNKKK